LIRPIGLWSLLACIGTLCANPAGGAERAVLVFAGDTAFGESYRLAAEAPALSGDKRYLPSMAALLPLLAGGREVLVNLETPLARPGASAVEDKPYVHWADPEKAVGALKAAGVTAVGLANNHSMDQGYAGVDETLERLRKAKIRFGGAGENRLSAELPLLWRVPVGKRTVDVAVFFGFEYRKSYAEKYRFYAGEKSPGVAELDASRLEAAILKARGADPGALLVVFPHWGKNYGWKSEAQARLARRLVDAGADLVIGHGAHRFQEIESYRGKWILYGLGNFAFHSPGRYDRKSSHSYSLVARLELSDSKGEVQKTLRLYPVQSDNTLTGFRSRPVTAREFEEAENLVMGHTEGEEAKGRVRAGKDSLGFHLRVALP
jgi:poly-gamma-glutamate capsule biosynthesis protein CapA/YwtB (metallophosphatase superfamily)